MSKLPEATARAKAKIDAAFAKADAEWEKARDGYLAADAAAKAVFAAKAPSAQSDAYDAAVADANYKAAVANAAYVARADAKTEADAAKADYLKSREVKK